MVQPKNFPLAKRDKIKYVNAYEESFTPKSINKNIQIDNLAINHKKS